MLMITESAEQVSFWTAASLRVHGVGVVAVKASEGSITNPYYRWQVSQARLTGCAVAHLHVMHPEAYSAKVDFAWFCLAANPEPGDLIVASAPKSFSRIRPLDASGWVLQWDDAARAAFQSRSVICTYPEVVESGALESVRGKSPLWLVSPGDNPERPKASPFPWTISFLQHRVNPRWENTPVSTAYFGDLEELADLAIPPSEPEATFTVTGAGGSSSVKGSFKVSWL